MRLHYFLFIILIFTSCKKVEENENTFNAFPLPPPPPKVKVKWLTENPIKLKNNSNLSYIKGFECDSVIGIDYIGHEGEYTFAPINEKGQFINTIRKRQKLNLFQISELNAIISNKKTYENANMSSCYEPELAFIYFKNNQVICQTILCLECSRIQSTADFGNNNGEFNEIARIKLKKLHNVLGFDDSFKNLDPKNLRTSVP